jgi:hypothetical protein
MRARTGLVPTLTLLAFAALAGGLALAMSHGEAPSLPADLEDHHHVNTLVVTDDESPIHGIHHFYMGETGRDLFLGGGTDEYPDGTTFVGKVFKPERSEEGRWREGKLAAYTLMLKDSGEEATTETGGWHFVMYGPDGTSRGVDPVRDCFGCHRPQPDTDFVLSTPLVER